MIDPRVLKHFGTSNNQLREFFTALPAGKGKKGESVPASPLFEKKVEFTKLISARIEQGRKECFRNYRHFAAVDLMMDSQPILPENIPLMAYAQGKINVETAARELQAVNCADEFIERKNVAPPGQPEDIKTTVNLPRLYEVCINVGRSFISRRANAQDNKYGSLRPFFQYNTRGTSMVDHVRSEVMSQYAETVVDAFGYRHEHRQCVRGMFNYRTVQFPAGAWECATQTHVAPENFNGDVTEVEVDGAKLKLHTKIEREGVRMLRPNPARVFYDSSHPLSSINTDTGCQWIGFWDVQRFGDIQRNPDFFNADKIMWSTAGASVVDQNRAYFDLVFSGQPINFPNSTLNRAGGEVDLAARNELKANANVYSVSTDVDRSVFVSDLRIKVVPKEWGMGTYAHPVWLRAVVASDDTVIYAEWLPSRPAVYWGHNEDDTRLLNIATAHEIMPWQDQLSNIFSQLRMKMMHSLLRVIVINSDVVPKDVREKFRKALDGPGYYIDPHLLEVSFKELGEGLGLELDKVFKIYGAQEASESEFINNAFKAIIQILAIMERLLNMSPQEQGQPAPREITAEEVAAIESTTQSTFNAIGASIDEARAAWKQIIYESAMAFASDQVPLPVSQRFSKETIEKAGFTVVDDPVGEGKSTAKRGHTVIGTKALLVHPYVFSTRDGGDRASNREAATVLNQFLQTVFQTLGPEALGKKRIFEISNEIFRLLSSYDLRLEMDEGEADSVAGPQTQQVIEKFGELQGALQEHEGEITGLGEAIQKLQQIIAELEARLPAAA